jgi:hypothetical protein
VQEDRTSNHLLHSFISLFAISFAAEVGLSAPELNLDPAARGKFYGVSVGMQSLCKARLSRPAERAHDGKNSTRFQNRADY